MNKIVKLFSGIVLFASIGTMSACKKSYDQPPGPSDDVNITANTTISTLKAFHTGFQTTETISSTPEIIISGIVTANDKSGNLYKQIFIQDTTGAMQVLLEASSVYAQFPVGRRIFIRCNGLSITDYHGTMELGILSYPGGIPTIGGILGNDINKYIVGGSINNPVVPIPVTAADLGTDLQNRYINALVQLEDYEFATANENALYADTTPYKNTVNDTIRNCPNTSTTLLVRTSAYANFAALKMPRGNGSITSIYTIYKSTSTSTASKQLYIRDTSDVKFFNPRCGSAPTNAFFLENFEAYAANATSPYSIETIPGWTNLAEFGPYSYTNRTFSSNKYAYTSPFGVTGPDGAKVWLVTKGVNMDTHTGEKLSFDTKQDFRYSTTGVDQASDLKILVSTNYTGTGNPWDAGVTWTDITTSATLSPGSTTGNFPANYQNSGEIDLSSYTGILYVAFVNSGGTDSNKTSSWEIDNIVITGD